MNRHRALTVPVVGVCSFAAALLALGCSDDGSGATNTRDQAASGMCSVGHERKARNAPSGTRATVLGCGRTREGRRIEIYSFRDAAGPCLSIAGMPGGPRACGRPPSERQSALTAALTGPAIVQRSRRAPIEVYGEAAARVVRVAIRYRDSGTRRTTPSTLIRMQDRDALEAAGIERPFGYFLGSVPASATNVVAEAQSADGRRIGRLAFGPVIESMAPTAFIAVER